jgi:hypothetical protein
VDGRTRGRPLGSRSPGARRLGGHPNARGQSRPGRRRHGRLRRVCHVVRHLRRHLLRPLSSSHARHALPDISLQATSGPTSSFALKAEEMMARIKGPRAALRHERHLHRRERHIRLPGPLSTRREALLLSSSTADSSALAKDGTRGPTPHTLMHGDPGEPTRSMGLATGELLGASCAPSGLPRSRAGAGGATRVPASRPMHSSGSVGPAVTWQAPTALATSNGRRTPTRQSGARGADPSGPPPSGPASKPARTQRCGGTGCPRPATDEPADLLDTHYRAVKGARSARTADPANLLDTPLPFRRRCAVGQDYGDGFRCQVEDDGHCGAISAPSRIGHRSCHTLVDTGRDKPTG